MRCLFLPKFDTSRIQLDFPGINILPASDQRQSNGTHEIFRIRVEQESTLGVKIRVEITLFALDQLQQKYLLENDSDFPH